MKLSETGLVPLAVLGEWKGEESGRRREVRGRRRSSHRGIQTGRKKKVMVVHV